MCLENQHPLEIFPGGQQLSRFAKALNRNKAKDGHIRKLLLAHGYTPEDIGVHSIRKGAGTYATNGIVAMTPSISAICLRAGWTQGSIKDVYLQFEHAQDTYLGRVLSGLPVSGKEAHRFMDLPATWGKNIEDPAVKDALARAFPVTKHPDFPASAMGLFHRMLAVIVKNHYWLTTLAPEEFDNNDHPYLSSLFYMETDFDTLVNKLDHDPTLMTPTGIVGHIQSIVATRDNMKLLKDIINVHLPKRDEELIGAIERLLDNRGINAPHATMQQIEALLERKIQPVMELVQQLPDAQLEAVAAPRSADPAPRGDVRQLGLSNWNEWKHDDGNWYAIPQNCKYPLPKCGVHSLLFQYYFGRAIEEGDTTYHIMPIKKMKGNQLPEKRNRTATLPACRAKARLAEARALCEFLENNIRHRWPSTTRRGYRLPPPKVDLKKMFEHASQLIEECRPSWNVPPAKRRKTCNQKGWSTHLRDVGKWKREQGYRGTRLSSIIIEEVEEDT